jgi:hypothetical protein
MRYQIRNLFQTFLLIILLLQSGLAQGSRFVSSYPCQDLQKSCEDKKGQVIDGVYIEPECWEYSYTKTCSYPSKDDDTGLVFQDKFLLILLPFVLAAFKLRFASNHDKHSLVFDTQY